VRVLAFTLLCVPLLFAPTLAAAHEGHAEAPGETASGGAEGGAVSVSEDARRNLGLGLAEAELRPIETTLRVIGEIAPVPSLAGTVSSRIAGRVVSVFVAEGNTVRRGQVVVEVESLQVGDPPPRARYVSPIDGTVIDRHVVAGESVEPNGHLVEIADLSEVLAVGRVFEGQIGRVAVGQSVRVMVPSFPGRVFEGFVERLGGQLDPASRSLPLYVRVKNPEHRLRPNMRAELNVVTERSETALAVPRSAVLGDFGALFVFVEDDDDPTRFERRVVVTGLSDDRFFEILEGVLPGERVVTEGNYSLQFLPPVPPEEATGEHAHEEVEPTSSLLPIAPLLAVATGLLGVAAVLLFVLRRMRTARGRA
jgi:multidrug efflux pump subunit AcrA (membrane-fusion protein)